MAENQDTIEVSKVIDNSLEIARGLSQVQAIGDLMSVCSDEGIEDGTIVRLGQLIRDTSEEVKTLWEKESESRMGLIRELTCKLEKAKQEASQHKSES